MLSHSVMSPEAYKLWMDSFVPRDFLYLLHAWLDLPIIYVIFDICRFFICPVHDIKSITLYDLVLHVFWWGHSHFHGTNSAL